MFWTRTLLNYDVYKGGSKLFTLSFMSNQFHLTLMDSNQVLDIFQLLTFNKFL